MRVLSIALLGLLGSLAVASVSAETGNRWLVYEGTGGPGDGVRIVLISGDEEYRSEEALPQLAAILAFRHGFHCTVLFGIDPETGIINPNEQTNIPGLETLETADLIIVFTRFRSLPDDQMIWIDEYLLSGRPVIGLRTATHAFRPPDSVLRTQRQHREAVLAAEQAGSTPPTLVIEDEQWGRFGHYGDGYSGPRTAWEGGFGRLVLGERWVAHHGRHKHESTRGIAAPGMVGHPILRGVAPGSVWGPTDVYRVSLPLSGDVRPLVLGEVVERRGDFDEQDSFFGMRPNDGPPAAAKNDPMMPVAWTKTYRVPGGKQGRVFATTLGASTDLLSAGLRRLIVNAVYWSLGKAEEIPGRGAAVDLVGRYEPTQYGFLSAKHHQSTGRRPADLRVEPVLEE
jgi:hypothetical protein